MVLARASTQPPPVPVAAITAMPAREVRRAGIDTAKQLVRHRGNFMAWLNVALLDRHELTRCGCGLIHCR
jgi:hypothetical protein